MIGMIPTDPMFLACGAASLIGLSLYFLYYESFIKENYGYAKWLRRTLFPHISFLLRRVDESTKEDLSHLYVQTTSSEDEKVMEIDCGEGDYEKVLDRVEGALKTLHFRPEVILASLGETEDGYKEIGNWVLTAPERNHPDTQPFGVLYDLFVMLISKWQLHIRIYYNEEEDKLEFYVHHEYNPYNPMHAKKHFIGEKIDSEKGKSLFNEMVSDDIRKRVGYSPLIRDVEINRGGE